VAETRDFAFPQAVAVSHLHDALLPIDPTTGPNPKFLTPQMQYRSRIGLFGPK